MKKCILIFGLVLLLFPATALKAQQTNTPPQARPMAMRHYHGWMMGETLNLTSDQQSKIQNMRLQMTKDLLPVRSQIKEKEADLKILLTSDKYDASKVNKTLDQITALQKQIRSKRISQLRAVRDLLTPEQQKKFDMMVLNGRWGDHAAARAGFRNHFLRPDRPDQRMNRK